MSTNHVILRVHFVSSPTLGQHPDLPGLKIKSESKELSFEWQAMLSLIFRRNAQPQHFKYHSVGWRNSMEGKHAAQLA